MLNTDPSSIESLIQARIGLSKIISFFLPAKPNESKKEGLMMLKIQNVMSDCFLRLKLRLDCVFIFKFYLPVWNTSYQMFSGCFGSFFEKKAKKCNSNHIV